MKEETVVAASDDVIVKTGLFIGSSTAIFLIAKYVTTTLLSLAIGEDEPWQHLWDLTVAATTNDFFFHHVVVTNIVLNVIFFGLGGIYLYFDLTNTPQWLRKYKIQPGTNEPLPWKRFVELMSQISFNQLFVGLPFSFFTYQLYLIKFNWDEAALEAATTQTLPSFTRLVMEVAIFVVFEELMFFYSHLALHKSRYLYSKIHKKHHEWQATVAYAAIYAHPIEHIMSNIGPPAIGPLICGSHVATTWLWYALVVVTTLNSHSGYHLPLMPSPEAHDFHHLRYNQCFGTLGLLDYLHGTDDLFRSNKAYQRHITLTSLKSAREKFPDARCVEDEKNK